MSSFVNPLLFALAVRPLVDGIVAGEHREIVAGGIGVAIALTLILVTPIRYQWATIRMRERTGFVSEQQILRLAANAPRIEHFERPDFLDHLQSLRHKTPELNDSMTLPFIAPLVVAQLMISTILLANLEPVLALLPMFALPTL